MYANYKRTIKQRKLFYFAAQKITFHNGNCIVIKNYTKKQPIASFQHTHIQFMKLSVSSIEIKYQPRTGNDLSL